MSERQQQAAPPQQLRHWMAGDWLDDDALRPLSEINAHGLHLMRQQAGVLTGGRGSGVMSVDLRPLWTGLSDEASQRLAGCPYALIDVGFGDVQRWRGAQQGAVHDSARPAGPACFDAAAAPSFLRRVLIYGWHLARAHRQLARVVFGMTPAAAQHIAALTLTDLDRIAERHTHWLRPRWEAHPQIWRQLLTCAGEPDRGALQQATLHGLQLIAGGTLDRPALAGTESRA